MNDVSFWSWVVGALCGALGAFAVGGFIVGSAFTKINGTLDTLNATLVRMEEEHDEHKTDNKEQIAALWKRQDEIRDKMTYVEAELLYVQKKTKGGDQ